jgi:flagellar biosynthetic protein FliR
MVATSARAAAFLYAAPLVGDRIVPGKVRAVAAALLALSLAPARPELAAEDLPGVLPAELLLGLMAGFAARLVLAGAEAGGELIGLHLGLGFAAAYDPALGEAALPTRRLAVTLGGLAFLAAGGIEAAARVVAGPFASVSDVAIAGGGLIARGGDVLVSALRFAAPTVVAAVVAQLALALASRAAPALNAFSVMLGAVVVFAGVVLVATAPGFVRELGSTAASAVDLALTMGGAR